MITGSNRIFERLKEENGFKDTEEEKTPIFALETNSDKILFAIHGQRWYYFKNKPKVILDKETGLLWANLAYFPWENRYYISEVKKVMKKFSKDNYEGWKVPKESEIQPIFYDKTSPFDLDGRGSEKKWLVINKIIQRVSLFASSVDFTDSPFDANSGYLLPNSEVLVADTDYLARISEDNKAYSLKERLQATLDLFIQNDLWPVFDDDEITQLYKRIYIDKEEDSEAQEKSFSIKFDYTKLLEKYDIQAINASVIQYYQAVQQWTGELLAIMNDYEEQKESVIRQFRNIELKLSGKYHRDESLTEDENCLLKERQKYFQEKFSLDFDQIRSRILSVKKQADALESRIDEIDNGDDAIHELAVLEQEPRASFLLLAENTAKIFRKFLGKVESFAMNHPYIADAVGSLEKWTDDYRVFKTTYKEDFKSSCEEDGVEDEIWSVWFEQWRSLRYAAEQKVQPMIEHGLEGGFTADHADDDNKAIEILNALEMYKRSVDKFYLEERKSIYQKYAFQSGGELQDRLETESALYHYVAELQSALQKIIFSCQDKDDRLFILKWADGLVDFQIDRIFEFVADHDLQEMAETILNEFAELKRKSYHIYLKDAKAYSEEKSRREKQYNSLIYKMRKNLAR